MKRAHQRSPIGRPMPALRPTPRILGSALPNAVDVEDIASALRNHRLFSLLSVNSFFDAYYYRKTPFYKQLRLDTSVEMKLVCTQGLGALATAKLSVKIP